MNEVKRRELQGIIREKSLAKPYSALCKDLVRVGLFLEKFQMDNINIIPLAAATSIIFGYLVADYGNEYLDHLSFSDLDIIGDFLERHCDKQ